MEKLTLLMPESTVQMLHLLARESGQTIGTIVHEMALDRYMQRAMQGMHVDPSEGDDAQVREA